MPPHPREQLFADMTNLYRKLQKQVGTLGLQLVGEKFDDCTQYDLLAGRRVIGKGTWPDRKSLLGWRSPIVPEEDTDWTRTLGVQVDLHAPFRLCLHVISATVAIQRGTVRYDSKTGELMLEKNTVTHIIGSRPDLHYTTVSTRDQGTYVGQRPGTLVDNSQNSSTRLTEEKVVPISDSAGEPAVPFAYAAEQFITTTMRVLDLMQEAGGVARRFRSS